MLKFAFELRRSVRSGRSLPQARVAVSCVCRLSEPTADAEDRLTGQNRPTVGWSTADVQAPDPEPRLIDLDHHPAIGFERCLLCEADDRLP